MLQPSLTLKLNSANVTPRRLKNNQSLKEFLRKSKEAKLEEADPDGETHEAPSLIIGSRDNIGRFAMHES